uniref:NodB homology domain-containing protein n=1 Tax=Daphnia galeata TaxID=27404 RepID=A0A8J2WM94_9CRUS|nr:unnamed protein product [Daphnia galeata]
MAWYAIFLALIVAAASGSVLPGTRQKAAPYCDVNQCALPDCLCSSLEIPGGLLPEETPQTVLITYDDAVNVLNYLNYSSLIFNRYNPNGCNIKATYFLSHEYNNYSLVNDLYNRGHEIASHSITHRTNQDFWLADDVEHWDKEMADMRTMIEYFAGGDSMWTSLSNNNFEWDCSWPTRNYVDPGMWPYTLDYLSQQDCQIGSCPVQSYPGKWVVPMIDLTDISGNPCAMVDTCNVGTTADEVYNLLNSNFEKHYLGNRAPFGLYLHAAWLLDTNHLNGYKRFLDGLTVKDDVYIVSVSQLLEWVKSPTPLSSIENFVPWQCDTVPSIPCAERRCAYDAAHTPFGSERIMSICNKACPFFYPWYDNIYGSNPSTPWVP